MIFDCRNGKRVCDFFCKFKDKVHCMLKCVFLMTHCVLLNLIVQLEVWGAWFR